MELELPFQCSVRLRLNDHDDWFVPNEEMAVLPFAVAVAVVGQRGWGSLARVRPPKQEEVQ